MQIDPVYVSEHALDQMSMFDQLTIVRNAVRRGLRAHVESTDGELVTGIDVEVAWLDGNVENLTFDKHVGFPLGDDRDWYMEWKEETLG